MGKGPKRFGRGSAKPVTRMDSALTDLFDEASLLAAMSATEPAPTAPTPKSGRVVFGNGSQELVDSVSSVFKKSALDRTAKVEHLHVIDANGNEIGHNVGKKHSVGFNFPQKILDSIEYATHNHPGLTTFSPQDVRGSLSLRIPNIEAVSSLIPAKKLKHYQSVFDHFITSLDLYGEGAFGLEDPDVKMLIDAAKMFLSETKTGYRYTLINSDPKKLDYNQIHENAQPLTDIWTKLGARANLVKTTTDAAKILVQNGVSSKDAVNIANMAANILIQHVGMQQVIAKNPNLTYSVEFE